MPVRLHRNPQFRRGATLLLLAYPIFEAPEIRANDIAALDLDDKNVGRVLSAFLASRSLLLELDCEWKKESPAIVAGLT